jgi:hypothetical protein
VIYYQAPDGSAPAIDFLSGCPGKIEGGFAAVLDAVAAAPPPRFSGGGKWEAMHGTMSSWHEIRLTGPGREQFRLFCLPENGSPTELARRGLQRPAIAAITGMRKPLAHDVLRPRLPACSGSWRSTPALLPAGNSNLDQRTSVYSLRSRCTTPG